MDFSSRCNGTQFFHTLLELLAPQISMKPKSVNTFQIFILGAVLALLEFTGLADDRVDLFISVTRILKGWKVSI